MSRNGSGVYSLPQPPFVPNTTISSAAVNSDLGDIATALTQSVSADGQTPITGILKGSTTTGPVYSSTLDHTTGFGVSSAGVADIWAGGVAVVSVTSAGITVAGTVNYTDLVVNSNPSGVSVTVTSATPGVVTWAAHGFSANQPVWFTAAAMPTGLNSEQIYYVVGASITTNTFEVAATTGGSAINTTTTGTTVLGYTAALQVIGGTSVIDGLTADNLYVNTSLTASGLNFWQPPQGTTVGRPGSPVAGYERYNTTLNVPEWYNGTVWQQPIFTPPVLSFRNLVIQFDSGTPNTVTDLSADAIIVQVPSGAYYQLDSVTLTGTIASNWSGGGNLDTGSVAPSTWYAIYVIYDPTTATSALLYSLSATSPTLPTGYTAYGRYGWRLTNSSSHFVESVQKGKRAQFIATSSSTALPGVTGSGTIGNVNTPTYVGISISGIMPSTASVMHGSLQIAGVANAILAPNPNWGGLNNSVFGPLCGGLGGSGGTFNTIQYFSMILESTSIYWATDGATIVVIALGWEDNI